MFSLNCFVIFLRKFCNLLISCERRLWKENYCNFYAAGSGDGDPGHCQWSIIKIHWLHDILLTSSHTTTTTKATVSLLGNEHSQRLYWWLVWQSSGSEEVKFTFRLLTHQANSVINQTLLKKKNIAQCLGLMSSTDIRNVEILVPKLILGRGGGIAELWDLGTY